MWSFAIGDISGIEIRVHYTYFLLVPLFALAGAALEGPGVAASLLWLVLNFACVVVHELAHCLVGRRRGAVVHEIVVLPIGGVSKLEHLPETPKDELRPRQFCSRRASLDALVDAVSELRVTGVEAEYEVIDGVDVADTLLSEAARTDAALLALGTHGRQGVARAVFGGVTTRVVGHATAPVLVACPQRTS